MIASSLRMNRSLQKMPRLIGDHSEAFAVSIAMTSA